MRSNMRVSHLYVTHEGGRAVPQKPEVELERAVATCLLFEPTFYETGESIAERIAELCQRVSIPFIAKLAVKARGEYKLRHVPLWLCIQLIARGRGLASGIVADTIATVIQRPDELAELLSLYWRDGKRPLSAQMKKGLAKAFGKFSAYQIAKWDRNDRKVKLRDVLFLCHARPTPKTGKAKKGDPVPPGPLERGSNALYRALVDGTLPVPDTWEVALSGGADKKETFERLLREKKLGYMALLQNLRNMSEAGVSMSLVSQALINGAKDSRALPFRFITACKHAPAYASALDIAMQSALEDAEKLKGNTVVVVDVSGSMNQTLSAKAETSRMEAASALTILLRESTEVCRIFTFSNSLAEVPAFRGLGLLGAIVQSQPHGGTHLRKALEKLAQITPDADRVVVVTDEQSHDGGPPRCWGRSGVLINVAGYKPAVDVSQGWTRLSGWSERVVDYIRVEESMREDG